MVSKQLLQSRTIRRHPVAPFSILRFWPHFLLQTPRIRWFLTGTLRKWNPRPACGTAVKSVRISISVYFIVDDFAGWSEVSGHSRL